MTMAISTTDIVELVQALGLEAVDEGLLIVGSVASDASNCAGANIIQIGRVVNASDVDGKLRADLAIVADQVEHMTKESGIHLLSRMRDLIARRVLLIVRGDAWAVDELLALGYLQVDYPRPEQNEKRPSIDGRYFLYDPNRFHEPREWNNSRDWANPSNFDKYRW